MSNWFQPHSVPSAVAPMLHLLGQLADVIGRVDDQAYGVQRARGVSGSIGSHVRHCLDHVSAFVAGVEARSFDYDTRVRGTLVETRRDAALDEIDRLVARLMTLPASALARAATVVTAVDDRTTLTVTSSIARELAFVVSHTIHHFAVIALLLRELGIAVPPRFGYAPTTPSPAFSAA
jgi:uncharacterized damage-inducible protein DinB